ncbi:hypothetical protein [Paenibacillus sp. 1P07SE]|uniref:hypothetical protein n=1 Tax=Paenibacillus sp. 1P07SE TaxID=3132209 RepID=UPI0039A6BD18
MSRHNDQQELSQASAEQLQQLSAEHEADAAAVAQPEPEKPGYDKKLDGPDRPSV